ncbi:encapsulin [Acaryochloris sp. IP29b_bin.137]|uniref:encapsulin n=1 Tax=Acaryochloris sp. IP29b_bin.137 TaxID=2969217 RepID=UPI00263067AB|nr:family 1 encapsulin nanocompartment shell protein [Acaryochloris sp. IP29b_bin.137]
MNSQIDWSSEQWDQIQQIVADEVNKVSVAGSFLACCGPLERSATVVRSQQLSEESNSITVDDVNTLKLWTLAVHVELKQRQLAEEHLTGAMSAFRRAANILARAEDAIVFNGLPREDPETADLETAKVPTQCKVTGGDTTHGLDGAGRNHPPILNPNQRNLVADIARAIATLESSGHLGPFACILGHSAFIAANTPSGDAFVLPKDRIEPMLGTQLLRSSTLDDEQVVVVSLAGDPIDLVVATSPTVQFLNVSNEARYRFRVYEKFVLRIKEEGAVTAFTLS